MEFEIFFIYHRKTFLFFHEWIGKESARSGYLLTKQMEQRSCPTRNSHFPLKKKSESLKLYRKHTCVWLVTLRNWILLIQTAATLIYWISLNNVTVSNRNFYSSKTIAWNKGCTRSSIKVIPFLENQAFVAFSIFVENVLNFVSPPPAKTQCISILKHYNHFTRAGWN